MLNRTNTTTESSVCFLSEAFFPIVGGGESHAFNLSKKLMEMGVAVMVVTRRTLPELLGYEEIEKVPVYRVAPAGGSQRWGKYWMLVPAIIQLAKLKNRFDIIYVCGFRTLGIAGVITALLFGKKCILRAESPGELSGEFLWVTPKPGKIRVPEWLARAMIGIRNRLLFKADGFLSITQGIEKEFLEHGVYAHRIHRIPNGIDTATYKPTDDRKSRSLLRAKLNLPDKKIFSYSGKLNRGKGLEMLLETWGKFVLEFREVHLVLIGSGGRGFLSCEQELKRFVEGNQLQDTVTFTGFVQNVHEFLQASDFFVFPSDSEALSVSVLEALACALPVVATKVGGTPEMIQDHESGLLIDIGAKHQLYRSLKLFMQNSDKASELGKRGRERVSSRFGIEGVARSHIEMFSSLTQTKASVEP